MLIDFNQVLLTVEGSALKDPVEPEKECTLKKVSIDALLGRMPGLTPENDDSGEVKLKLWELARLISKTEELLEIKAEELATIKNRIGKFFGAVVVGPSFYLLEGKKIL